MDTGQDESDYVRDEWDYPTAEEYVLQAGPPLLALLDEMATMSLERMNALVNTEQQLKEVRYPKTRRSHDRDTRELGWWANDGMRRIEKAYALNPAFKAIEAEQFVDPRTGHILNGDRVAAGCGTRAVEALRLRARIPVDVYRLNTDAWRFVIGPVHPDDEDFDLTLQERELFAHLLLSKTFVSYQDAADAARGVFA